MELNYNISFRKKDKGWQYIISYKVNKKWKQKAKQGFETRTKAKIAANDALEKLKEEFKFTGSLVNSNLTFKELKDLYFSEKKYYIAASTIHNMEISFKVFDYLEDYYIKDITKNDIQIGITKMIKKGNKPITIKSRIDYIKILFNFAINKEILYKNPTNGVNLLKDRKDKSTRRALKSSEVNELLYKLKHARGKNSKYYYIASLLAYSCGLRIGEILGLNFNDFDFENCTVKINKQYSRFSKELITDPKSRNSNRVIPVPYIVLNEIKNFRLVNNAEPEDMIFNLKSIESFDKMINNRYKSLGFNVCIHELRHTYATELISTNKIDIKTAAYLLGHDVKMTMNVYTHVNQDMINNAKIVVNNMINNKLEIIKDTN